MNRLVIRGGRIIDPANHIDRIADLYVADGRILALDKAPDDFTAERVIDATNRWVLPGLVDLAARLREPGEEHIATIASETRAAAAAGITTLCCPPDTDPVLDTPAVAELIHQRAEQAGYARVVTLGALTQDLGGQQLSEIAALKAAGCVGVSNASRPMANTLVIRRALEYAATFDLTVFIQAVDPHLSDGGCAHEGPVSTRLGLPGIPSSAETSAVAQLLALIEEIGVRAHFCRLSSAKAVHMIGRAQYDGATVTADVSAHQLQLTENDILSFNSHCHVIPPLRTLRDRDGLRTGLARGTLGAICSDHQPHEADAKLDPFPNTEPGISALETLLPLSLRLVEDGVLKLSELIARLTIGPARILGLEAGTLRPGVAADVVIYDPQHPWRLNGANMLSSGKNTPFAGWEFAGRVTHTLLDGRVVWEMK